jgi:hypothetical protein
MADEKPKPEEGTHDEGHEEEFDAKKEIADVKAHNKKLSDENAARRNENKDLKNKLAAAESKVSILDALGANADEQKEHLGRLIALGEKADEKKPKDVTKESPEVQQLKKELADFKASSEAEKVQTTEKFRQKAHKAAISELIATAGITEAGDAQELLRAKTRWDDEKEVLIATVKDDDGEEQEIVVKDKDILKKFKLLPSIFWPAEGVPGSGSRGTRTGPGGTFDPDKAMTTHSDFVKNKEKIREAIKSGRTT